VLSGAVIAFAFLNLLAVLFGAGVAAWIPEHITAAIVAVLFAVFGIHTLRADDDDSEDVKERGRHGILLTTLALATVSGLGVWAGSILLKRLPTHWMHRTGGVIFLLFSLLAAWRAISGWA